MKKFPNALVIILGMIVASWVATYLIPQGTFERITNEETEMVEVVNNSYKQISADHLSIFDLMLSVPRGIVGRADLIVLVLLIGGCFYIVDKTGALNDGLNRVGRSLEGKESSALIIVSALFAAAGATIGLQEEVIAMTPALLIFGKTLGYNPYTTIYISYGSSVLGSSFGPSNPFAVLIAQSEAQLPLLSGTPFRLVLLCIAFVLWVGYILHYYSKNRVEKVSPVTTTGDKISFASQSILILLAATFAIVIFGLLKLDWGFMEMSACFFLLGLVVGIIGKLGINGTAETYMAGFKEMIFPSVILGLAYSISIILKEGNVIDSIVYGLFGPLQYLPPSFSAVVMMISHGVLHIAVPSYSGQAIMTMPILVPLSDLIGISRQTCVLAYQYGAVMMDMVIPTNGTLMAVLAVSAVPFNKWIRFCVKPMLLIFSLAAVAIVVATFIGYS